MKTDYSDYQLPEGKISIEFTVEGICQDLKTSETFNPEDVLFSMLARWLGSDHLEVYKNPEYHLSTLEKLEILCMEARKKAGSEAPYEDKFNVRYIISKGNKCCFTPEDTKLYDHIRILDDRLAIVTNNGLKGLATIDGTTVIDTEFDLLTRIGDNHLLAEKGVKKYLFTIDGKQVFQDFEDVEHPYLPQFKNCSTCCKSVKH